jgi:iron complex transport system ATP-binding protein
VTLLRGTRVALESLTLSIHDGEHVAILGPNGSGKSSLIKAISRECYPLQRPGSSLQILGQDRWNIFELRSLLGIVSNDLMQACTRDYSVEEVILSGFFSSIGTWPNHEVTDAMRHKTRDVMSLLEISHLSGRNVDELSSGEARRVLIGRALVHAPKALLLDEPTNSLDLHAAHELHDTLRKLAQSGTTVVLVTHHLPDIIPEIERVVLIQDGKILEDGAKERVLTAAGLSRLFGTAVEVVMSRGYYHVW